MATKKAEATKKEFQMEQALVMWRKKSSKGGYFFSGLAGEKRLVGFYNGKKKNPKEPDIRIYECDEEGKAKDEEFISLWMNVSKNDKKYLSGKLDGKKVVGFIYSGKNEKAPYFTCYYSNSEPKKNKGAMPTDSEGFMKVDENEQEKLPF